MQTFKPAFVLHRRKYRETSAIVDLLIDDVGVRRTIIKGVFSSKAKAAKRVEPFSMILVAGEFNPDGLSQVKQYEAVADIAFYLQSNALACGFYLNELILKFSALIDEPGSVFHAYSAALQTLSKGETPWAVILREFEYQLFAASGIAFGHHDNYEADCCFFHPEAGLVDYGTEGAITVANDVYEAWLNQDWNAVEFTNGFKRFHQQIITHYLGNVEFKSKALFQKGSKQLTDG